ncbi:MAG: hypothetical protein ACLGIO_03955 [Acidimicrobiia bacterium]
MLAALRDLHAGWAWVVVVGNGAAGLWALGAERFPILRHRALWWLTAAAQAAVLVQVVVGVRLLSGRDPEPARFHMFYGFVALAAVGILYSYRHQLRARIHLLYGLGGLFVTGLAIRAMTIPAG